MGPRSAKKAKPASPRRGTTRTHIQAAHAFGDGVPMGSKLACAAVGFAEYRRVPAIRKGQPGPPELALTASAMSLDPNAVGLIIRLPPGAVSIGNVWLRHLGPPGARATP